jgi:hypothetical protein
MVSASANIATADLALCVIQLLEEWGGAHGKPQVMVWMGNVCPFDTVSGQGLPAQAAEQQHVKHWQPSISYYRTDNINNSSRRWSRQWYRVYNNDSVLNDEYEMTYHEHFEQQMNRLPSTMDLETETRRHLQTPLVEC